MTGSAGSDKREGKARPHPCLTMRLCLGIALGAGLSVPAMADMILTTGSGNGADAFVQKGNATTNYGTDGNITIKGGNGTTTRKGYLRFDLSGVNFTITGATLTLTTSTNNLGGGNTNPTSFNVQVYGLTDELLDNWVEGNGAADNSPAGEITWNNAPANDTADNDINTMKATLIGSFAVPAVSPPDTVTFSVPALVTFLNNDTNGLVTLILRRNDSGGNPNLAFASDEHASYAAPTLTLVPEPATVGLLALGACGLIRRRRA